MTWFELIKLDGITHFHGTNKAGVAEKILREGIKPMLNYNFYRQKNGDIIASKHVVQGEKIPEMEGKYTWVAKEPPLGYAGWWKEHQSTQVPSFDDAGNLTGIEGKPKQYEFKEGGMFGIKGSDIDWIEVYSPCYRLGTIHYVTQDIIPPEKLVYMDIDGWEKWYKEHDEDAWEKCAVEFPKGKVNQEIFEDHQTRINWTNTIRV